MKTARKKSDELSWRTFTFISLAFISIITLSLFLLRYSAMLQVNYSYAPALSLKDYELAEIAVQNDIIFLRANCSEIEMITNVEQAQSISRIIENLSVQRPNSHDLTASMLKEFNIAFLFVRVKAVSQGSYIADTVLKKDKKVLILDSKPSDAIAIAVRMHAPVYIRKELMQQGKNIC